MIYFDNAATTFPKPAAVWTSMERCGRNYCGNPGRSGHLFSVKTGEAVFEARMQIAEMIGAENAMQILFTGNATEALNLGIKGILRKGDHVVTTSMEHNSVLRPLKALEKEGVETSIVKAEPDGSVRVEQIRDAIRKETRMIVCTHVSNVCGTILPVKKIGALAKERQILFFIDASQSAGCLPIDVKAMGADLLAAPGHKGLLGPQGTGFLYVSPDLNSCLNPLKQGGTGTASKSMKQPSEFPEAYESGTLNAVGIVGLHAGMQWIRSLGGGCDRKGIESIHAWEQSLTKMIDETLRSMNHIVVYGPQDSEKKTGVTAFNIIGRNCETVAAKLSDVYGIAVRAGYHCAGPAHRSIGTWSTGAIRISVGPFNSKKETEQLLRAIYELSKDGN